MVSGKNMWFHGDFQGVVTTLERVSGKKTCDFMVVLCSFRGFLAKKW